MQLSPTLLQAWQEVLRLCRVEPATAIVLLKGGIAHEENVAYARLASSLAGARMTVLELDPYSGPDADPRAGALGGNRVVVAALKRAELVLDMMGMDRGGEQFEVLAAGTRILLVKEPPATLVRLVPCEDDKRRVMAATARLRAARTMHITSPQGTDLRVDVGEYPCLVQYGYADEPGHWDHWPSAFVATWPNERSARGRVVLSPGDAILPFKQYVRTSIALAIDDGYIRSIDGGLDARYMRDYMDQFRDPEGYAVSHLGWGLYERAHWTSLGMTDRGDTNGMESRSFSGNFMFSTGPNSEAGGSRHTLCHLDIPMLDCTVELDGEAVIAGGRLVDSRQATAVI